MAERILMTPDELRSAKDYLYNKAEEITSVLEDTKNKVDEVDAGWEGAADDAFMQTFQDLYEQMISNFPPTVQGIGDMLKGAADALDEADSDIASSLSQ